MSNQNWQDPYQYQPPNYQQQPNYQQPPQKSNTVLVVLVTVLSMLLLGLAGFAAYFFFWQEDTKTDGAAAMTSVSEASAAPKSTVTETVDAPPPGDDESEDAKPTKKKASSRCNYSSWDVTDSQVTTPGFARNVFNDFKSTCRSEGTPNVTLTDVYSPRTGKYYTMTCRDRGDQVVCTGGRNAAVYIS